MSSTDIQFVGGHNIALKIPKFKYAETVHFYKEVLKLPYLGYKDGTDVFQHGPNTLWLDCMINYAQQDVWLEVAVDDLDGAAHYLREQGVSRRDEVEVHEDLKGYWISDPCGTIIRVNAREDSE